MKRVAVTCCALLVLAACSSATPESSKRTDTAAVNDTTAGADTTLPTDSAVATTTTTPAATSTSVPWLGPCGRSGAGPKSYDHIVWIWMENKDAQKVFNATTAPFLNGLAASCGSASAYVDHAIHPSLPNYLAATSGDPQGVTDDKAPAAHPLSVDNLFRQVRTVGKQAKSYQEAMPSNCALQSTDRYAVKHNPAAYFVGADDRTACERDNVGLDQFVPDLQSGLPAFSLITPDICNDMHDCAVAVGDAWLKTLIDAITASPTYREGRTAVFVVFDESEGVGTMPFFAVAPNIVPGTRTATQLDHYALLAFTEDVLGITTHLGAAATAPSLAAAFGL